MFQVCPFELVMIRFTPLVLTATKVSPPKVTELHELLSAELRGVQVIPSVLVITPLVVTERATTTNMPLP
jgi:hypothetical protein